MLLYRNPTPEKIQELIASSGDIAPKWIKGSKTGDTFYWPSDQAFHARMAEILHITKYDK